MTNPQQVEKDKNVKPFEAPSAARSTPVSTTESFNSSKVAQGSTMRTESPGKLNINAPEEVKAPLEAEKKAV